MCDLLSNGRSNRRHASTEPSAHVELLCMCGYQVSARDRKAGHRRCLWCRLGDLTQKDRP